MSAVTYVGDWLRRICGETRVYTAKWTDERSSRAFTEDERAAVDRAFAKFDEAFRELDTAFKGWR